MEDVHSIPTRPQGAWKKALPFGGNLYQGRFSAMTLPTAWPCFNTATWSRRRSPFSRWSRPSRTIPTAYYNLGTLSLRRNDFPQARHYLEQTLKLRPDYPEAWNNLGMMAAQEGHPEEAIQTSSSRFCCGPDMPLRC